MSNHEQKPCPRCHKSFECKPGNITQCQCYGFEMNEELKTWLEYKYSDCVCRECLEYLKVEVHLFKEKYLFKG